MLNCLNIGHLKAPFRVHKYQNQKYFTCTQLPWMETNHYTINLLFISKYVTKVNTLQGEYFQIRRRGGLGPHIKFGGKIWGKVRPSSQNKRKSWEVLSPKDAKVGKSPNFGVISEIQRAKFGVFVIYIFGGKIWGSNKNFRGKIWGQAPPTS